MEKVVKVCQDFLSDLEGYFTRILDFTWRASDCEELSGGYSLEMMGLVMRSKKPSKHIQNCPSMTDECQYTFATNYFMYQWAGACLPPEGKIRVQAAPASELILYIGPHLTPD